jgi:hypothetical protein
VDLETKHSVERTFDTVSTLFATCLGAPGCPALLPRASVLVATQGVFRMYWSGWVAERGKFLQEEVPQ